MKILRFIVLFAVPMILGVGGFLAAGENLLQALFQSVQLFVLEYGDPPANFAIEFARWLAPLATAGSILMAVHVLRTKLHNAVIYRKGDSVAVYGPVEEKEAILKQLDGKGIDGGESFVRAHRYILLGNETENLSFYRQYRGKLENCSVYLKCTALPAQAGGTENVRLFCPEEIASRLFWKQHCLYEASRAMNHQIDVVFIGFGKLGEELLTFALQNNVFAPEQQISYHIFGDGNEFLGTHPGLKAIKDPVKFYGHPWYESVSLLEQAAMVIVAEQEHQLELLRKLLLTLKRKQFHVFAADAFGIELMAQKERLCVFDWKEEAGKPQHILSDALYDRAKRINMRYVKKYDSTGTFVENEENKQMEWKKLSTFHRYSNIRSADHHEIQKIILEVEGIESSYDQMDLAWRERLSVLEHISWCNYHYLNNWECGESKDQLLRTHPDLVAYDTLNAVEKCKDLSNIEVQFSCD